jgi:uncharacterized membrane protein
MSTQGSEIPGGRRRVGLAASIVLNLFLIALIAGHVWQVRRMEAHGGTPLVRALARAEAALPPRDAAAFAAIIRRDAPRYAGAARQLNEARQALGRAIAAQEFKQDEVRSAFAAWQASFNRFFADFRDPLIEALAAVSPEGRRKLVAERRAQHPSP